MPIVGPTIGSLGWLLAPCCPSGLRLHANLCSAPFKPAKCRHRRRLPFAQPGDLSLGLLFLAPQPVAQIHRALLCSGGALAQGCKLYSHLLLLA
jgi:hypothetical protein